MELIQAEADCKRITTELMMEEVNLMVEWVKNEAEALYYIVCLSPNWLIPEVTERLKPFKETLVALLISLLSQIYFLWI